MGDALIYCRISKDAAGEHLGIDRQERLCRDLAARLGLDVVDVLGDNDVSAYRGHGRPAFEALVEALKAGRADTVLVYHVDRLYRRMADLERLVEVVEATAVDIHTVAAGDVDLSTASGRMVARMLGAAAQHESERIGERMRMKHDELAARGRAPGGRAPYGYRWTTELTEDGSARRGYGVAEEEAAAVRTMASRVLEGASLLAIAREMDAAGITTREGRPWHHSTVRAVLLNPAVAGLRVHRREVAGPGNWPAILDRATWEQVRATLADPVRKRTRPARKHLLAGLVFNQRGEKMNGSVNNQGNAVYSTRSPAKQSLQIPAVPLEDLIVEAVLYRFDNATLPTMDPSDDSPTAGDEIARLNAELDELAGMRGRGEITLAEWIAARRPLQERIEAARRTAGPGRRPPRDTHLLAAPGALRREWPSLDFAAKREILSAVIDRVVIGPADRGRWTELPSRVDVRWRA